MKTPSSKSDLTALEVAFRHSHPVDPTPIVDVLMAIESILKRILGPAPVREHFHRLLEGVSQRYEREWRSALTREAASRLVLRAVGQSFSVLKVYANKGTVLTEEVTEPARRREIETYLAATRDFLECIPFDAWKVGPGELVDIYQMATARFAFDSGAPVPVKGLALLGGVKEHTVRNLIAGDRRKLKVRPDGMVAYADALEWLGRRSAFEPSTWMHGDPPIAPPIVDPARYYLVPYGSGTPRKMFYPGYHAQGVYHLGTGRQIERVSGYDNALMRLQSMPQPAWQKPTDDGEWEQMAGNRWTRMLGSELLAAQNAT